MSKTVKHSRRASREGVLARERERNAPQRQARDQFDQLYSDWLNARAAAADPRLPKDEESERGDRRDAAARALLSEPIVEPWMIWQKWEVLESFLEVEAFDDGWSDRRVIAALGNIKTDLATLGVGR
jgi:hypothetical protein